MATFASLVLVVGCICAISGNESINVEKSDTNKHNEEITDLKSAASTYYPRWIDPYTNSGYGVTGHGTLDDKNYKTHGGYDNYQEYKRYDGNYAKFSGLGYTGAYDRYRDNPALGRYSEYTSNLGYKPHDNSAAHLAYSGNGGYGGYGGNGGLGSYLGYNNPYYHGANHLGFGYYKKPGLSSIYNSGITPSLVTGYRGYSRK